ncbi:sulfotransferase [Marinobacter xestospongiae]|uniref:Sulfotransferase n=1 Tax=Marinobacter xestospongiae TaxID=994319 RepID=A0ABU3VZQ5_9GAMM|nr:sulfotransferase [Marinobacter xestospongiae]MDV2079734.1 sulfotransferase [Marinobacter xestospongiae]
MKPNFVVIGAARSGTTSLFQYLEPHPEIGMSQVKELNFFSNPTYWNKGFDWYESRFPNASSIKAAGEASTSYTKAPFTDDVPGRIAHYNPAMRLIYVVRDPIERYLSHYLKRVQTGIESRPFERTLDNLDNEASAWQGRYFYQLEHYLQKFDRDQLLVFAMEDLKHNAADTVKRIYRFLNVDETYQAPDLNRIHNATNRVVMKSPMGKRISEFYRRHLEQRDLPFTFKKAVASLGDIGGQEIRKPALTEAQRDKLQRFYQQDSRWLQREFGIDTSPWVPE